MTKGSGNQKQATVEPTEEDKSYVKIPYSQRPTQALMASGLKNHKLLCTRVHENAVWPASGPQNCITPGSDAVSRLLLGHEGDDNMTLF